MALFFETLKRTFLKENVGMREIIKTPTKDTHRTKYWG